MSCVLQPLLDGIDLRVKRHVQNSRTSSTVAEICCWSQWRVSCMQQKCSIDPTRAPRH